MNIGALLVGAAILIVSTMVVFEPFRKRRAAAAEPVVEKPGAGGEKRREALLGLRSLDFDYELGQIREEDYVSLRAELLLKAGEAFEEQSLPADDRLEALIQARRERLTAQPARACVHCHGAIGPDDLFCPTCGQEKERTCPECGYPAPREHRFCTRCGHPFQEESK